MIYAHSCIRKLIVVTNHAEIIHTFWTNNSQIVIMDENDGNITAFVWHCVLVNKKALIGPLL